jgi:hypothetical protein
MHAWKRALDKMRWKIEIELLMFEMSEYMTSTCCATTLRHFDKKTGAKCFCRMNINVATHCCNELRKTTPIWDNLLQPIAIIRRVSRSLGPRSLWSMKYSYCPNIFWTILSACCFPESLLARGGYWHVLWRVGVAGGQMWLDKSRLEYPRRESTQLRVAISSQHRINDNDSHVVLFDEFRR